MWSSVRVQRSRDSDAFLSARSSGRLRIRVRPGRIMRNPCSTDIVFEPDNLTVKEPSMEGYPSMGEPS
eukprot:11795819-Alexandrium_andersonii.AAC.1